jgi:hypothetical protein
MKKSIMKKWVAALRSGEFEQGTEALERYGKYCCLGVLSALASVEGVCDIEKKDDGEYAYDGRTGCLPASVMKWAGIKGANDNCKLPDGTHLTILNDNGTPFTEIANLVEANYKDL